MGVVGRLVVGSSGLIALTLLAASCASVPASRVQAVREGEDPRIGPLASCGYVGEVRTAASSDTDADVYRLREQAGRRGANTVVIGVGPGLLRGKAFSCPARESGVLAGGAQDVGPYGPPAPSSQGYPKGALDTPADPRH